MTPLDDLTIVCGDLTLTFTVAFDQYSIESRSRANQRRLIAAEWAELTITSRTPLPYDGFQRHVKAIMDLLTLTAHAPAGVLHETLHYRTSSERLQEMGVDEETAELYARQTGSSPLSVVDRSGVDLGVARRVVAGE